MPRAPPPPPGAPPAGAYGQPRAGAAYLQSGRAAAASAGRLPRAAAAAARRAGRRAAAAARRPARARRRGRSRLRPLRAGPHAPRVRAARRGVRVGPGRGELRAPSGDARGARRRGRARGGGARAARAPTTPPSSPSRKRFHRARTSPLREPPPAAAPAAAARDGAAPAAHRARRRARGAVPAFARRGAPGGGVACVRRGRPRAGQGVLRVPGARRVPVRPRVDAGAGRAPRVAHRRRRREETASAPRTAAACGKRTARSTASWWSPALWRATSRRRWTRSPRSPARRRRRPGSPSWWSARARAATAEPGAGLRHDKDPAGMRDLVSKHFDEWARVSELPSGDAAVETFLSALAKSKLLLEDSRERFARILVELATTRCLGLPGEPAQAREPDLAPVSFGVTPISKSANESSNDTQKTQKKSLSFAAVDAFVRLIASLCRRAEISTEKRPALLASAPPRRRARRRATLSSAARCSIPGPYHRLILGLMVEMHAPDVALDASHPQVLASFAGALLALQPSRAPGFAYAWLELISHRCFLPRALADRERRRPWPTLRRLLVAALTFLEPFLRAAALSETVRGCTAARCVYSWCSCTTSPSSCATTTWTCATSSRPTRVQMRNLVLSAFRAPCACPTRSRPTSRWTCCRRSRRAPRVTCGADDALKTVLPRAAARSWTSSWRRASPRGFPDRLRRAGAVAAGGGERRARATTRRWSTRSFCAARARRRGERGRRAHVRGRARARSTRSSVAPGAHRAHGGVPAPSRRSGRRGRATRFSAPARTSGGSPNARALDSRARCCDLFSESASEARARADHARATGAPAS